MSTLEPYLSLRAAAAILPGRPHLSTLHRWRKSASHDARLQAVKVGGRWFVAVSELERFLAAVTAAVDGRAVPVRTATQRQQQIEAAERVLDRLRIGTARVSNDQETTAE